MFDVRPFLEPTDRWVKEEGLESVLRIYDEKFRIAQLLQPRTIVEIGVRYGYSAAAFLSGAPLCRYLGLDADNGQHGGQKGAYLAAEAMLRRHFGEKRSQVRLCDTQELSGLLCYAPPDLAHVDGDHNRAGALHDLRLAEKVARWILLDDVTNPHCGGSQGPEVALAAADFLRETGLHGIYLPTVRGDLLIQVRREPHGGGRANPGPAIWDFRSPAAAERESAVPLPAAALAR